MPAIESLIKDKLNLKAHNTSDINYIVNSYLTDKISDNEMTSWLKAIFNNGMNIDETIAYTSAIINSGTKLQFNFELLDDKWHHSGKSTKGKPIYEIWSKRADLGI